MLNIKCFFFNPFRTCCYVAWKDGSGACAVVDPGCSTESERAQLDTFLAAKGLRPEKILLTHGHFDHIFGVAPLVEKYGCPVCLHPADGPLLTDASNWTRLPGLDRPDGSFPRNDIREGDLLTIGNDLTFKVIETPGHTLGGVSYYDEADSVLFSGDTLFYGTIGRTDLAGGDYDTIIRSIMDKLMGLPGGTEVLPGHGCATTIAREAASNPFLIPFNEPEPDWTQDGISLDNDL